MNNEPTSTSNHKRIKHCERETKNQAPRTKNVIHSSITLLLSPNVSVSTPMRWAIRSSRLLMWASGFAGRLQSP